MKPESEKVDMATIAKMLDVSKTTVHYAIRNTGRLSAETRKRVLKAVETIGYRPDGLARSFRRGRTDTLGVVVATLTNSIHAKRLSTSIRFSIAAPQPTNNFASIKKRMT